MTFGFVNGFGGFIHTLYVIRAIVSTDGGDVASSGIRRLEREWHCEPRRIAGTSTRREFQNGQGRNRGLGMAVGSFGREEEEEKETGGDAQEVSPDKGVLLFDANQVQYN